jgi:glutamate-5-semialdehyde dehydrogenase
MIYEARPNVTADAAGICFKTGNAVILRGSSEAKESNLAIAGALRRAVREEGGPEDALLMMEDTSREAAAELMRMNRYLDALIPRGGAALKQTVIREATVPVIETGVGNCHVYVDADADLPMAVDIIVNAKCSRPSVCNAAETLLLSRAVAAELLPKAAEALAPYNVRLHCCPESLALLRDIENVTAATETDWETEYNDFDLAVKVVGGADEAVEHIARYGSKHSEAIVTGNYFTAKDFAGRIDAAAVYINASTRFTDGEEFGLGAEIGISTQKLHVRGPMGLSALTGIQYIIEGEGQVRV